VSEPEKTPPRHRKLAVIVFSVCSLVILALVAIPNTVDSDRYSTTPDRKCVNNLRLIDGAKVTWALEHNKTDADIPTWADIVPYIGAIPGNTNILKCPSGGTYTLGAVSNKPKCSIQGHALP